MFQSIGFKRFVFCFLLISFVSMLACQGDEAPVIVSSADQPPDPGDIEDDGKTRGELYSAGNPYHDNIFEDLLQQPGLSTVVSTFEARGFELSPASCFTIDGDDGESAGTVTFVILEGAGRVSDLTVMIACFDIDGVTGVSPAVFSVYEPDDPTDWTLIDGYGWMKTDGPGGINRSATRLNEWSWPYFWDCMKLAAPGPVVGCSISCVMVGPGYLHCLTVCVASQAVVATVTCMIKTFRNGITNKKEDPK
jgi:hypothetical protein